MSRGLRTSGSRRRGDQPPGVAPWILTYGDLVTLLLVFFVMLFAFSTLDVQQFRAVLSAIQGSLGILDMGRGMDPTQRLEYGGLHSDLLVEGIQHNTQMEEIARDIYDFNSQHDLQGEVHIQMEERGVVVRFADQVLFDLAKADLRPEAVAILDRMSEVLKRWPNFIRVEGHTDNWPIRTERFPSNWELSTARATTVVRHLIARGIEPARLAAVGYGEYRPVRPNDTAENRAANRRVDIVLLRADVPSQEPSPAMNR